METQREYLRKQIADRIAIRGSSVNFYRGRHYWFQTILLFITGGITVLSGINLGFLHSSKAAIISPILTNIVLFLGAASTGIAAYGAFFSPQESWHLNAKIYADLRSLQSELEFSELAHDFKTNEAVLVKTFFERYQAILADYNREWQALRQKSK